MIHTKCSPSSVAGIQGNILRITSKVVQRLSELEGIAAHLIARHIVCSFNQYWQQVPQSNQVRGGGGGGRLIILHLQPDNWVPTSGATKKSYSFPESLCCIIYLPLSHCLSISSKLRHKVFRLVSCLCILRFSITLNISLVYDQILLKAGMYINLLPKKLGQPFSEIHADSISANKQKKVMMVCCVFVWI